MPAAKGLPPSTLLLERTALTAMSRHENHAADFNKSASIRKGPAQKQQASQFVGAKPHYCSYQIVRPHTMNQNAVRVLAQQQRSQWQP